MIREAVYEDLEQMLDLYLHLHERKKPEKDNHLMSVWDEICKNPDYHLIVAEKDGKIVSSCTCIIIMNLTKNVRPYALIENVVTDKAYRGQGFATECLAYARDIAEKNNCYKMMLLTGSKKRSTLRFYRKAGYNSIEKKGFIQRL